MKTILKTMMTVLVALFSINAWAYDAYIDGIYYNLVEKAKEAIVTNKGNDILGTYAGIIDIPESVTYEGVTYSVTSISSYAFYNSRGLTSVSIPKSMTSIDEHAFGICDNLTSVHITDLDVWCKISFGSISSNPLKNAHHLYLNGAEVKDLNISSSVTEIGQYAFAGCSGLTSVIIPNSVTRIGESAFESCSGLTSVTIPNSVTSIGTSAFESCSGLTSVTIPNSVTSINRSAFYGCI